MTKGESTRSTIIDTALCQALRVGIENVSIGTLASATGLSKSGLYAHFRSKEALQLAVIDAAIDRFRSRVAAPALEQPSGLSQLRALFLGHLDWIAGRSSEGGCPFTGLVQEFDRRPGRLRDRLVAAQRDWRALLVRAARSAAGAGEISPDPEPDVIAFQLYGAALAYQIDLDLLDDGARGRERAISLFNRIASQGD